MATKLTGVQKAAIFIMSLDPKIAKELMGKLNVQEKNIIRQTTLKIKKTGMPIFLKIWETFKNDVNCASDGKASLLSFKDRLEIAPTEVPESIK